MKTEHNLQIQGNRLYTGVWTTSNALFMHSVPHQQLHRFVILFQNSHHNGLWMQYNTTALYCTLSWYCMAPGRECLSINGSSSGSSRDGVNTELLLMSRFDPCVAASLISVWICVCERGNILSNTEVRDAAVQKQHIYYLNVKFLLSVLERGVDFL